MNRARLASCSFQLKPREQFYLKNAATFHPHDLAENPCVDAVPEAQLAEKGGGAGRTGVGRSSGEWGGGGGAIAGLDQMNLGRRSRNEIIAESYKREDMPCLLPQASAL